MPRSLARTRKRTKRSKTLQLMWKRKLALMRPKYAPNQFSQFFEFVKLETDKEEILDEWKEEFKPGNSADLVNAEARHADEATADLSSSLLDSAETKIIKKEDYLNEWQFSEEKVDVMGVESGYDDGSTDGPPLVLDSENTEIIVKVEPSNEWMTEENIQITGVESGISSICASHDKPDNHATEEYHEYNYQITQNPKLTTQKDPEEGDMLKFGRCSYQNIHNDNIKGHIFWQHNPHEIDLFLCANCNFQTMYKSSLKIQSPTDENSCEDDVLKCNQCQYQTVCEDSFKCHLLEHKPSNEIEMFRNDCQAISHSNIKTQRCQHVQEPETLRCQECHCQAFGKEQLETQTLRCDRCDYMTNQWRNFKEQLRHPNANVLLKCVECNFMTCHKSYLNKHLLSHRPIEVTTYKCAKCEYQTVRKNSLKTYYNRHRDPEDVTKLKCVIISIIRPAKEL